MRRKDRRVIYGVRFITLWTGLPLPFTLGDLSYGVVRRSIGWCFSGRGTLTRRPAPGRQVLDIVQRVIPRRHPLLRAAMLGTSD